MHSQLMGNAQPVAVKVMTDLQSSTYQMEAGTYFELCKWSKWPDPAVVGLLMEPQQKPKWKPLHSPTHHEVMWITALRSGALSNCQVQ